MNVFAKIYGEHEKFWSPKRFLSLGFSVGLFLVALYIQKIADAYVARVPGTYVGDILLSHLPTVNLDFFIVQGALLLALLIIVLLLAKPKYIPFTLKSIAIFTITRSFFISLTHLGVDPHVLKLDTHSIGYGLYNLIFNAKDDFFFSGHTGLPFLMGLIFWKEKFWRYCFFIISFVFGSSVLLAHIHYSIDVFASPFITYSIFVIAVRAFPADFSPLGRGFGVAEKAL